MRLNTTHYESLCCGIFQKFEFLQKTAVDRKTHNLTRLASCNMQLLANYTKYYPVVIFTRKRLIYDGF